MKTKTIYLCSFLFILIFFPVVMELVLVVDQLEAAGRIHVVGQVAAVVEGAVQIGGCLSAGYLWSLQRYYGDISSNTSIFRWLIR